MKITIDTKKNDVKAGGKCFNELNDEKRIEVENTLRKFLRENTQMSEYEEDCMWMSYRYCIGRHTIASHMHANDIWKNCRGRMSKQRQLFNAFDINREIEQKLTFGVSCGYPSFHFPLTSLNKIYTPAVDIVCQFMEDYEIKSEKDLLKYRDVHVILTDNEWGYKIETTTWEEWLRSQVHKIVKENYMSNQITEDKAWEYFEKWKKENSKDTEQEGMYIEFKKLISDMPNPEYFYLHDFEDLFVWNDLVHCFDFEHHHKSILTNGEEVEWFWTWTNNSEKRDDGYYYRAFGYHKIRVPVNDWNGGHVIYIPDESIKEDIY